MEKIIFRASLYPSTSAFSVSAEGDVKLSLAIPAQELGNVAKCLLLLKHKTFKVSIELPESQPNE